MKKIINIQFGKIGNLQRPVEDQHDDILPLEDGEGISLRHYSNAMEFADAAEADDEVEQDIIDELDEAIEFGKEEDRPDITGYSREAKHIINHRRLGHN